MAAQTSARYLAANSKQLLGKHRAASLITLTVTTWTWTCGESQECSGEPRQWQTNWLPSLRKHIQTPQENKLPSENANSYVVLQLQVVQLSHGSVCGKADVLTLCQTSLRLDSVPSNGCGCQMKMASARRNLESSLLILQTL